MVYKTYLFFGKIFIRTFAKQQSKMSPGGMPMSAQNLEDTLLSGRSQDPSKPCRACTDFKTWAKLQSESSKSSKPKAANVPSKQKSIDVTRSNCPLDKDEIGNATWSYLHTMAAYYPDAPTSQQQKDMSSFIDIFTKYYPCDSCAKDFRKEITASPPEVQSQHKFSQWLCAMHNKVNKKIGKPIFDCTKVNERWRDGWLDGSCD